MSFPRLCALLPVLIPRRPPLGPATLAAFPYQDSNNEFVLTPCILGTRKLLSVYSVQCRVCSVQCAIISSAPPAMGSSPTSSAKRRPGLQCKWVLFSTFAETREGSFWVCLRPLWFFQVGSAPPLSNSATHYSRLSGFQLFPLGI